MSDKAREIGEPDKQRTERQEQWYLEPMLELASQLHEQTAQTWRHSGEVARYALIIAKKVQLDPVSMLGLQCAAMLRDVGLIHTASDLLEKPSALSQDEGYSITKHALASATMLRAHEISKQTVSVARAHHEWYNGKGYPLGLEGNSIPIGARILSLADALNAMSENRPHRKALTRPQIIEELKKGAGTQFDPELVLVVLELFEKDLFDAAPRRVLRVISDDPTLYAQLWFASYPHGWEIEVWPHVWAETCSPDFLRRSEQADVAVDMTIIDGRCMSSLPESYSSGQEIPTLWLDPVDKQGPALSRPLSLSALLTFLDADAASRDHFAHGAASIRVLLADPYHLFRQALKSCLGEDPNFDVVAEASSPREYKALRSRPDYDVAIVASDLLAGTRSTAPLGADDLHLDGREINGGKDHRPVVVLVTDEDADGLTALSAEDIRRNAEYAKPVYLHRSVSIEILAETVKFMYERASLGHAKSGHLSAQSGTGAQNDDFDLGDEIFNRKGKATTHEM
jgi:DNA-binding NarL/FixJ family response regulator